MKGVIVIKIDRLIGIITLLLQKDKITAPELAKLYEVSRRTINRDIEDICKAGIPIVTTQGVNGGIAIMENYKIDKTLFNEEDLRSIFIGLSSLDSVSKSQKYRNIISKFATDRDSLLLQNSIMIDLSSHYKETIALQIELLQSCIEKNTKLSFTYHNKNGEKIITVAPYLIIFQWSNWYFLGMDSENNCFKIYKLNRIINMQSNDENFELQEIPTELLQFENYFTDEIQATILFNSSEKYKLIEEYGLNSFIEQPDGALRFSFNFTNQDYLLSWVLSFGDKAELIEPSNLRPIILDCMKNATKKYE